MSGKKKNRVKTYTLFRSAVSSVFTAIVCYMAFAIILSVAVNSEKLRPDYMHYAAVVAAGVSCLIGVWINAHKNREKRMLISAITAATAILLLLLLPIADGTAAADNLNWHSMISTMVGCAVPIFFTRRIIQKRKR